MALASQDMLLGELLYLAISHYYKKPQLLQARSIADKNFTAAKKLCIYSNWECKAAGNTAFYVHPTASLTTKLQGHWSSHPPHPWNLGKHAVSSWQAMELNHWCPRTWAAWSAELHRMVGVGTYLLFNPIKSSGKGFQRRKWMQNEMWAWSAGSQVTEGTWPAPSETPDCYTWFNLFPGLFAICYRQAWLELSWNSPEESVSAHMHSIISQGTQSLQQGVAESHNMHQPSCQNQVTEFYPLLSRSSSSTSQSNSGAYRASAVWSCYLKGYSKHSVMSWLVCCRSWRRCTQASQMTTFFKALYILSSDLYS